MGAGKLTAALQRLCLLDWLMVRCHPAPLTVSETDSSIRVERQVVSLGFFQNHGHQDVLKSRLVILDLPAAEAFCGLSEVWGGEGKLLFSYIGAHKVPARMAGHFLASP